MNFENSKRSGWLVISEFVGTYNRCWSFDIQIFYDENEKKINHLNIHHTAQIDVIPNIKAAFHSYQVHFSSFQYLFVSFLDLMSGLVLLFLPFWT